MIYGWGSQLFLRYLGTYGQRGAGGLTPPPARPRILLPICHLMIKRFYQCSSNDPAKVTSLLVFNILTPYNVLRVFIYYTGSRHFRTWYKKKTYRRNAGGTLLANRPPKEAIGWNWYNNECPYLYYEYVYL